MVAAAVSCLCDFGVVGASMADFDDKGCLELVCPVQVSLCRTCPTSHKAQCVWGGVVDNFGIECRVQDVVVAHLVCLGCCVDYWYR
jgi:hypothetical protein